MEPAAHHHHKLLQAMLSALNMTFCSFRFARGDLLFAARRQHAHLNLAGLVLGVHHSLLALVCEASDEQPR